jgi:hypothetical protein
MTRRADLVTELVGAATEVGPLLAAAGATPALEAVAAATRHACRAAACSVATLEADRELWYRAADGEGASTVIGMRLSVARGIAGFVAQSGQALAINEPRNDPRFAADVAERTGYVPRTIVAAPATDPNEAVIGVVTILDPDPTAADALAQAAHACRVVAASVVLDRVAVDLGRVVLDAFAAAAPGDGLAAALRRVPSANVGQLASLVALIADARRMGEAERRTAETLLSEFVAYASSRRRR